jgi:hypothetical protein
VGELYKRLKTMQSQPLNADQELQFRTLLNEYNNLLMRAQLQREQYPPQLKDPMHKPGIETGSIPKADRLDINKSKLDGPEPENKFPSAFSKEGLKDAAAVPAAAFHALAMRPYNAAKTLMSPEGQYQPGTGDAGGVDLSNQAAGALATGGLRGGGGFGAMGGKGSRGPYKTPKNTIEQDTAELHQITQSIAAATKQLNELGAKKAQGGFGRPEFEAATRLQNDLPRLIERGKALQQRISRAGRRGPYAPQAPKQWFYDPANKKPGSHAGGVPGPGEAEGQTIEQFHGAGNT